MGENGAGKSTLIKALTGVYAHRRRHDRASTGASSVVRQPRRRPRTPASARSTRRSTSAPTCRSPRTSCSAASRAGSARIDWRRDAPRRPPSCSRGLDLDIDPASMLGATRSPSSSWSRSPGPMDVDAAGADPRRADLEPRRDEVAELFAVIRDAARRGRRDPVRLPLPRPGLRDLRPHHVLRNGRLVGEYLIADLPSCELVAKMIGHELDVLERPRREAADRRRRPCRTPPVLAGDRARAARARIEPVDLDGATRARSSAWPGCSAPAAPSSPGCSSAPTAPTPARSPSTASPVDAAHARVAPSPRGIAFSSEDRKGEGIVGDLTVAREHRARAAGRAAAGPRQIPRRTSRRAGRPSTSRRSTSARPTRTRSIAQPVRRQPAEGAARPLAGHRAASC